MSEPIETTVWAINTASRLAREAEQARIIEILKAELVGFCPCMACRRIKQLIENIEKEEIK